jgi:hypothetical protein
VTIAGDLASVRAVARQMRGAVGPPEARRLASWARSLDDAARGIDRGVKFLRETAEDAPSEPETAPEPQPGPETPEPPADARERRRRQAQARAERPPKPGTKAAAVLDAVAAVARDPRLAGLTDVELAQVTGLPENSVRPRRGELVTGGWLVDSGASRIHHGAPHRVWVLTEKAAAILAGSHPG